LAATVSAPTYIAAHMTFIASSVIARCNKRMTIS
jgi:hypothetical protein